jgi:dihydroorotase
MDQTEPYDVLVRGGLVIGGDLARYADVAINGETIAALIGPDSGAEARIVIDAIDRLVLPGLVDSHVHFQAPGRTEEQWRTGSRAAVAGGVTTVIDMPDAAPPTTTARDAHDRHRAVAGTSLVDYRLHGGVERDRPESLSGLTAGEATSVRVFDRAGTPAGAPALDPLFALAADNDLRLLFHAEDAAACAPPAGPAPPAGGRHRRGEPANCPRPPPWHRDPRVARVQPRGG